MERKERKSVMELEKIGSFITQQRKEKEMTQKQMGDALGVSDKTISKWECGKGMPDISIMIPLCELLDISVNELLSGEHLTEEAYQGKAEENMVDLIKEQKKISKKQYITSILSALLGVITLVAIIALMSLMMQVGDRGIVIGYLVDMPSAIMILAVMILFLLSAGLLGDLWRGIRAFFVRGKVYEREELQRACTAVKAAGKTTLFAGVFESLYATVVLLHQLDSFESFGPNMAVALLSLFDGTLLFLLFLPVRGYLERRLSGQQDN